MFPDARFVMTHRDPTDVMLSVCDVYADICGTFTDDLDSKFIGELNVKQWTLATDRALAFREAGNDDRFYDIDFRAMQADPIGEVRGLYEWLGEPVTDEFESRMQQWWTANAENREPSPARDPPTSVSTSTRSGPASPTGSPRRSAGPTPLGHRRPELVDQLLGAAVDLAPGGEHDPVPASTGHAPLLVVVLVVGRVVVPPAAVRLEDDAAGGKAKS